MSISPSNPDSVSVTRAVPLVADGGFENPIQPNTTTTTRYKLANGGGGGTLTGTNWDFGGSPSGITRNGSAFAPPVAPEGSQAAILRGTADTAFDADLLWGGSRSTTC